MRARVSDIESYRYWRADEAAELEPLLEKLRGGWEGTPNTRAGTAFHAALEASSPGEFAVLQAEGHVFFIEADAEIQLPDIREIRCGKTYMVDGVECHVSGQVDCIEGKRVDDHKTTSQMDAERFWTGCQWKFYLDIHDADRFRWNVFEIREASDRFLKSQPVVPEGIPYVVHGSHRLEQFRYPKLQEDCQRLAEDFFRFARIHLPERFQ